MNRETESHFSNLPSISIKRSSFKRPNTNKLSFNAGDLIPCYLDELLPGDTVKMKMASITRMQTPIFPVFDNAYQDVYFFAVPIRILWKHWKEFWGENNTTHWEQPVTYTIPQITAPASTGWVAGTIADYLGIPINTPGLSVSHLPFRCYAKIWNDWFRDENLKDPCMITDDETTVTGTNTGNYVTYAEAGGEPLKVAKFHDYFTSALPSPQKSSSVLLPLGKTAPVVGAAVTNIPSGYTEMSGMINKQLAAIKDTTDPTPFSLYTDTNPIVGMGDKKVINLATDLSKALGATINDLRQAFAVQAFYEAQARGGSRYIEFIKNIFGVTSPDGRLQRPEYLGGTRFRLNMDQVLQTSSTDSTSPQGHTTAFSCTVNTNEDLFTYSATEHCYIMGVTCVRTDHTYQQGLNKLWLRKKNTDFYVPQFANLGEMPIYNAEIYADGSSTDGEVFGYQEAWAEYRFHPSEIHGELRSAYAQSLDYMHYGDDYATLPTLSSGWIDETTANIDRTIAVQSTTSNQFFGDMYFDPVYVRPMPIYSVPAMLNHF